MQRVAPAPRTYSRQALAAEFGVSPRRITHWVHEKLIPKAHGRNPRWAYYDDLHVRAIRRLLAEVYDHNVTLAEYRERHAHA